MSPHISFCVHIAVVAGHVMLGARQTSVRGVAHAGPARAARALHRLPSSLSSRTDVELGAGGVGVARLTVGVRDDAKVVLADCGETGRAGVAV